MVTLLFHARDYFTKKLASFEGTLTLLQSHLRHPYCKLSNSSIQSLFSLAQLTSIDYYKVTDSVTKFLVIFRSSHQELFCKKAVAEFIFTGKHL